MKRTNYILSEDQHEALQKEAEGRGVSVSEALRRIVDEWKSAKLALVGMELISVERIDVEEDNGEYACTVPARVVSREGCKGRVIEKIPGIRFKGSFHGFHLVFGDLFKRICVLTREEEVLEIDLDSGDAPPLSKTWDKEEFFTPEDIRAALIKKQPWESLKDKKFW